MPVVFCVPQGETQDPGFHHGARVTVGLFVAYGCPALVANHRRRLYIAGSRFPDCQAADHLPRLEGVSSDLHRRNHKMLGKYPTVHLKQKEIRPRSTTTMRSGGFSRSEGVQVPCLACVRWHQKRLKMSVWPWRKCYRRMGLVKCSACHRIVPQPSSMPS